MIVFFYNFILKEVYLYDLIIIIILNLILINSIFSYFMKNPVYSLIFLILNYSLTGFLFIFNGMIFLGIVFMLVYVGAISILLLFVIMLLNLKSVYYKANNFYYSYFLVYLSFLFEIVLLFYFYKKNDFFFNTNYIYTNWFKAAFLKPDFVNVGYDLFFINSDILCFIGIFLTIIMIAAVNIVNGIKTSKKQDKFVQLKSYKKIISF